MITVEELIDYLMKVDDKSKFVIDGDNDPITNVEEDNHTVSIF